MSRLLTVTFTVVCCLFSTAIQEANGNPMPSSSENGETPVKDQCMAILKQVSKMESSFSVVGHAIHSMTVRDLRLFDSNATAINYIPTINRDTSSSTEPLLPHAPDIITDGDDVFITDAMKTLNYELSHMDDEKWDMLGYGVLEKIVHEFHMKEVWARAFKQFEKIKASPPSSSACQCVLDIENNGILEFLRSTALAIREPTLIYGGRLNQDQSQQMPSDISDASHLGKGYAFAPRPGKAYFFKPRPGKAYFFKPRPGKGKNSGYGLVEAATDNSEDNSILKTEEDGMGPLANAAAWKKFNADMNMSEADDYNAALFIYCAVQKAHQ